MALEGITKVGELGLERPFNFPGGVNITGVTTATGGIIGNLTGDVNAGIITATGGIRAIGIQSGGVSVYTGVVTALNFVGTGNTFAVNGSTVDISISGGGGASVVYDATVFAYKNVIDSNIDLDLPHKTAVIYADPDVTVDIESGSTLSVGDGVFFSIIDI